MNIVVPLTNLSFLKDFYYPTVMQGVAGRTVLEHAVDSLQLDGQYHFVLRWEDHTKYSIGNFLESTFPGAIITVTKSRIHGDAEAVLYAPVTPGPLVVFDAASQLLWNSNVFLGRINQSRADAGVTVFPNFNRKYPHIKIGGYHSNCVSRILHERSNFAVAGLYYFGNVKHYMQVAPSVIKDELEMNYRPIGVECVLNKLIGDGAKTIYHRCARRGLSSLDQLVKFEQ